MADEALQLRELERLARQDPWAVPTEVIRGLRRSPEPGARAIAALVHALRRPRSYLRTAQRWWRDESDVVRAACMEGLGLAAILEAIELDRRSDVRGLLTQGKQDRAPAVRRSAQEASWLLCERTYAGGQAE
jgi:hypothetical protein